MCWQDITLLGYGRTSVDYTVRSRNDSALIAVWNFTPAGKDENCSVVDTHAVEGLWISVTGRAAILTFWNEGRASVTLAQCKRTTK